MPEKLWRKGKWITWGGRGFWAVTDQALFALSHFALNILLARWLVPEDYGAFAVAFTLFLLIGALHTGILTEPMQVFGPGKHKERFGNYLYVLIKGHAGFGLLGSALFALAAIALWFFTESPLTSALGGLAFALPFILFQWLLRKATYVLLTPILAAKAGMLYMVLMLSGLFGLHHIEIIGSAAALIVMGSASLLSGLWLAWKLHAHRSPEDPEGLQRLAMEDHWRYGRWAMMTGMLGWVPGNIVYLLLPVWHGLEMAAVLRALNNLIMPVLQIKIALFALLLPVLVRLRQSDYPRMLQIARNVALASTLAAIGYWVVIGLFATTVVDFLYAFHYTGYANLIWALGVLPVITIWMGTATVLLRTMERPDLIMRAHLFVAILSIFFGVFIVWVLGLIGGIALLLSVSILKTVLLFLSFSSIKTLSIKEL